MGRLRVISLEQLEADGCQLAVPHDMFRGLLEATADNPCETGCAYFEDGACPAYKKHHSASEERQVKEKARCKVPAAVFVHRELIGGKWAGMSIKQIAAKEGISLNEARKRKQEGKYVR